MTLAIPWTVACQAPLSIGFSRQEYWNGLPFPSPGDLSHPGIKPSCIAGRFFTDWATRNSGRIVRFFSSFPLSASSIFLKQISITEQNNNNKKGFTKKSREFLLCSNEEESSLMLWTWRFQDILSLFQQRSRTHRRIWNNRRTYWLMKQWEK